MEAPTVLSPRTMSSMGSGLSIKKLAGHAGGTNQCSPSEPRGMSPVVSEQSFLASQRHYK